jgi:hypothetical protein
LAALQAPTAKPAAQEPEGVPKEAKVTAVKTPPMPHEKVTGAFSGAPSAHVAPGASLGLAHATT